MPAKTDEERLEQLEKKEAALKADKRKIKARIAKRERAARTHRLVQVGAVAESVLGSPIDGDEMLHDFKQFLEQQEARGSFFSRAMMQAQEPASDQEQYWQ